MATKVSTNYLVEGKGGDKLVLPSKVVPEKYYLHLHPDVKAFTFKGHVDITLNVREATNVIVIHSIEIDIKSATIAGTDNPMTSIVYDTTDEVAVITFQHELAVHSKPVLAIDFTGILNDKMHGFYRSKYTIDGEDRYLGTTQFEATDARRAFPCFDEPALKATFDVEITVPKHLTALSNMRDIKTVEHDDGTKTVTFGTTPKMSTYLAAFVVGEFNYVEGYTKGGVRTRIYSVIGKKDTGDFALDVAIRALDFFCDYFQIPYPLDKCDHIGVPDFSFGAMENWGLITYREIILLTSETTTVRIKQRVASVIGHELAHQWFGNLVTMEWWSQLWLNEGFATYMGDLVTDHLFPEWGVWLEFSNVYNGALGLDVLENSHAIEVPVYSSSQINEIFDAISYNKGSCVIRMLAERFGDDFRKGLTHYLTKFAYQNTNTEDLWNSISHISGSNVKEFIDEFTKYPGYPVINFEATAEPGKFNLTQKQFRYTNEERPTDPCWKCHIKLQTQKESHEYMLDTKTTTITVPSFDANGWIKPNFGQTGYYRIKYDPSIIKGLLPQIQSLKLPAVDRLGLFSDAVALSKAHSLPITVFLDLAASSQNEVENTNWTFIMDTLGKLLNLVDDTPSYDKLKRFTVNLLTPVYKKLGFDAIPNESAADVLLREKVLARLAQSDLQEVIVECRKRYDALKAGTPLPSDIQSVVYRTVLKNGGEQELNEMIEIYKKSTNTVERATLLSVISSVQGEALINKVLAFSFSADVKMQDAYYVWFGLPNKSTGIAWKYLVANFESINETFKESGLFPRIISSTFAARMSEEQIVTVEKFFEAHPVNIAARSIKQDLEIARDNSRWYDYIHADIAKWLVSHP
ncbi:hypothetical protein SAMD00019534_047640 [Acytostelium subglobosum LB1]|uniref:hypothetical protein n=1 Tax=Acytostelium subglobosum LB1 TaxID=1410327 RepID=UPI00064507F4|nr:hypothetical protein SAMD00019534_047640 [Acytostelium subglobosum LB1]GAM21589.1 hypothetical protein SAMD00019534_047640 [Acytostelium subglobosum LB1]|eukprot:XP_012755708.1 hypothetical protein SAMD00019534_047640 [Acytostelium subglobosum LB1]